MLILTRKVKEKLFIGNKILITILTIKKNKIILGINAPKNILIYREEIYHKQKKNKKKIICQNIKFNYQKI